MPVVITLQIHEPQKQRLDLELPENVPVRHLIAAIIQALHIPATRPGGWLVDYRLGSGSRPFPDHRTLEELGIKMGDILDLIPYAMQLPQPGVSPFRVGGSAVLRFLSGRTIPLDSAGKPELLIGRRSSQSKHPPDVDLSLEAGGDTVSRTHARLLRQGQQWVLIPLPTRNGTFIGGTLLPPNQPYILRSGDVISFGAVRCVFESARP